MFLPWSFGFSCSRTAVGRVTYLWRIWWCEINVVEARCSWTTTNTVMASSVNYSLCHNTVFFFFQFYIICHWCLSGAFCLRMRVDCIFLFYTRKVQVEISMYTTAVAQTFCVKYNTYWETLSVIFATPYKHQHYKYASHVQCGLGKMLQVLVLMHKYSKSELKSANSILA